jgi:transposase
MFDIAPKTLHHWYKHYLSDYQVDKAEKRWCSEQIQSIDRRSGEIVKKPLYVFEPKNIGEQMSIDDKAISSDGFTILSNSDSGKMALMIESCRAEEVEQALQKFGADLQKIKSVSMDLSATYALVFNNLLPRAVQVADKFHVMAYVYQAVNSVRLRIKRELQQQLSAGKKRTEADRQILKKIELLRRVSRALRKSPNKWSNEMKETVLEVFSEFEVIEKSYQISQQFKQWYDYSNRLFSVDKILHNLHIWCSQAVEIAEFKGVVKMIRKHETKIVNFFKNGSTNAKAERLNGKIERFVSGNYGVKDKDFFLYRTAQYFS